MADTAADTFYQARLSERYRMVDWLEDRAEQIEASLKGVEAHNYTKVQWYAQAKAIALRDAATDMRRL